MKKNENECRGSDHNPNLFKEHISSINNTNLILCLVCKESLTDYDSNNVLTHVLGSSHQANLKNMFLMCVPDTYCDSENANYLKIILNSVFDLSILQKNETNYIHRYENHIVCLICRDIICEVNHCDDNVKDNIFHHVQNESHLDSIKRNVCWVYRLEPTSEFIMFHKTVIFCSVCNKEYLTQENVLLQYVVNHLLNEHPKAAANSVEENVIDNSQTDTEIVSHTHLELIENNSQRYFSTKPFDQSNYDFDHSTNIDEISKALFKSKDKEHLLNGLPIDNLATSLSEGDVGEPNKNFVNEYENQKSKKIKIAHKNDAHPLIITVQCAKKFNFCVVCKATVEDISSGCHTCSCIPSHLWSPGHKENIELLTYQCIPDPFCNKSTEKYNELALVINSETGCVRQHQNDVICKICKNAITNITQTLETVKYDLVYHFGSKQHINSMRENAYWFYYLKFSESFIDFNNHITHCNECALNLESAPGHVVQCVIAHFSTGCELLLDRNKLELNRHYLTTDCKGLVCSECKETVEIYNDDHEFSMDLHLEKHKELAYVNNHLAIKVSSDDAEYTTCSLCLEEIPTFNRDKKLSLSLHECSAIGIISNQSKYKTDYDISMIFGNLPDTYKAHRDFIIRDEDDFLCTLCNCTFLLPNDLKEACKMFENHITELYHNEQYNACNMVKPQPFCKTVKKVNPWDMFNDTSDNPGTISLIKSVIEDNSQYIGKREKYYFCNICQCCFLCFGNEQEVMKIFASHFMCKNHKKKLQRYLNNESSTAYEAKKNSNGEINNDAPLQLAPVENNKSIVNQLKSVPGFKLNSQFFFVQGDKVYCELCKISVPRDKINKVKKHCYSESHSMILVENAENYITDHKNKQLLNANDLCSKKFVKVLKKVAENCYRINDPTITPNLLYIDNNGKNFVCLLCNMNLKFSLDGSSVVNHFSTKAHKQRTYRLSGCVALSSIEENSNVNQLSSIISGGENDEAVHKVERLTWKNEIENTGFKVSDFFEKFPSEYSVYRDFISVEGKHVLCQLCSFTLLSKNNFEADCKILKEHILSLFHREQYLLYNSNGTSSGSENKDPWERFENGCNFEARLEVQNLNERNKEYIEKGKAYFACCICNAYFLYFDEQDMRTTFAAHCLASDHAKNLKRNSTKFQIRNDLRLNEHEAFIARPSNVGEINNDIDLVLKKATKSPLVMILNKRYLRGKENLFFCDVCQVFIEFSKNGSHLKKHCYSQMHNNILMQNSITFVECLDDKCNFPESNQHGLKFKNVLKMMAKTSYKQRNTIITANLFFINFSTRSFFCRLCNKKVTFSKNGSTVMSHIVSEVHAKNTFKLISRHHTKTEDTPVDLLCEVVTDCNSELIILSEDLMTRIPRSLSPTDNIVVKKLKCNSELNISSEDTMTHIATSHTSTMDTPVEKLEGIGIVTDIVESNVPSEDFKFCIVNFKNSYQENEEINSTKGDQEFEHSSSFNKVRNDSGDSWNNVKLGSDQLFNLEVKSHNLTWDLAGIEVESNLDYVCPDCNDGVTIIDEDVSLSFEEHYKTCHLNIEELSSEHGNVLCNNRFLKDTFDCLPDFHQRHIENIAVKSDFLYCSLCKSIVCTERSNIFDSAVELFFHFSSKFHKEKDKLHSIEVDLKQQISKYRPEVHVIARHDAPEDVKQIFSNSQNLLNKI